MINNYIREGAIVPVRITCALIKTAMQKAGWAKKKYLIDGFPRNKENYDGWQDVMGNLVNVPFLLHFHVSEKMMFERCLQRGQGRIDDNMESLKKRNVQFKTEQMEIIKLFASEGKERRINCNKKADKVYNDVLTALSEYLNM